MEESRKCGALWSKTSEKTGTKYYSGELIVNGGKVRIVAFNRDKKHDKEPDIDILISKPAEGIKTYGNQN